MARKTKLELVQEQIDRTEETIDRLEIDERAAKRVGDTKWQAGILDDRKRLALMLDEFETVKNEIAIANKE